MKVRKILLITLILKLYNNLEFILIRHGARSPNVKVNYKFKYYKENSPGQLTEQGFMESIELSKKLKLSKLQYLNKENCTIFVSHYLRCINTAEAYLIGMNINIDYLKKNNKIYIFNQKNDTLFNNISKKEKKEIINKNSILEKNIKIIDMLWDNLKNYNFLNLLKNLCINCKLNFETHYYKLKLLKTLNSIIICINHNNLNNYLKLPINFLLEIRKSAYIFYDLLYFRNKETIKKILNDFLYILGNKLFNYLPFREKLIYQKFAKKLDYNLNSNYFLFFGHDANLIAFLKIFFDKDQFNYFNDNVPEFNSYIKIKLVENNYSKNLILFQESITKTEFFIKIIINGREIFTNKCWNMNCPIEKFIEILNEYTN